MTLAHKFTVAVCVVLLGILVWAGYGWLKTHDELTKASVSTAVQQKDIDALKSDEQQTAATLKQQLQVLEAQKSTPATPQQIVIDASKLVPSLPQPLQVTTAPVNPQLPDGPQKQQVIIPADDMNALRNYGVSCQENADKLNACTKTSVDTQKQVADLTTQRDTWEKAAKGGSFWHRLGGGLKHSICGAGAAGVGMAMAGSNGAKTSALDALGTLGFCELLVSRK
jgi:hypothetical protein